ncbi:MAG: sulfite exporter TauE/SafE family protein, partial [Pseudomonadota bacterium]
RLEVSESVFTGLLGASLLFAGIRLLSNRRQSAVASVSHPKGPLFVAFGAGGLLGLLSGIVGIGGGIFLAPILYFLNWGRPKEIAAACSLFILVNSLAGLLGQSTKLAASDDIPTLLQHWPLFIAVLIGGQIGARLGASRIPPGFIQTLTGILIVYVALRLLYRFAALL